MISHHYRVLVLQLCQENINREADHAEVTIRVVEHVVKREVDQAKHGFIEIVRELILVLVRCRHYRPAAARRYRRFTRGTTLKHEQCLVYVISQG